MCQINEKPVMVAKNAQTKPVALLRGISIASYVGSSPNCALSMASSLARQ